MAKKQKIDFGGVPQEIRKRGRRVPEGDYGAKITAVERKKGQQSGSWYYSWTFQILTDDKGNTKYKGTPMYFITSLKPTALFNLRNLIFAATGKNVAGKSVNFDPDSLIGKKIAITVEDEEYEAKDGSQKISSRPQDVFPISELGEDEEDEDEEKEDEDEEDEEEEDEEEEDEEEPKSKKKKKKSTKSDDDDDDLDEVDIDDDL